MMQRFKGKTAKAPKTKEQDEETINELREAFKIFDSKNTGTFEDTQGKLMLANSKPS